MNEKKRYDREKDEKNKDERKQDEKEKEKEKEEKEKERVEENSSTSSVLLASTAIGTALASAYFGAKDGGKVAFLRKLENLTNQVEETLSNTQNWIDERKRLYLPVPQIVLRDVKKLGSLLDLIQRMNNHSEETLSVVSWVGLFSSSSVFLAGLLKSSAMTQNLGLFGGLFSLSSLLIFKGLYSSPIFGNASKSLLDEIQQILEYYNDLDNHSFLVFKELEALTHSNQTQDVRYPSFESNTNPNASVNVNTKTNPISQPKKVPLSEMN